MIINIGARLWAEMSRKRFNAWEKDAVSLQQKVFEHLISQAGQTLFGRDHDFGTIKSMADFQNRVPLRDYEGMKPYVERIIRGESDVLWPGRPIYFAKTSGTTSGSKFIPITRDSMPNHINSARQALLMYILKTGSSQFLKGKYIFISGSPELDKTGDILSGRLSGIVHHHVPSYLNKKKLPSYPTNCISDWEKKLDKIIEETLPQKMSLISGIPPWLEMYFERLLKRTGAKTVLDVFPHFSLLVHGGVNFNHYSGKLFQLIGREIDTLETYPASEGFIAFQDAFPDQGLLLIPDSGIFYEFVPADQFYDDNPPRMSLSEVETDVNYAIILNTNAGLWGYVLGDTVRFLSTNPYRLRVSGRLSQFTSAFGEHVIGEEAEKAISAAVRQTEAVVTEFTLAPMPDNPDGLPCHQWFIEFNKEPADMNVFARILDEHMQQQNAYYRDLVLGNILQPAMVVPVPQNTFRNYMKSRGKLGGQNKVPHLSNERDIALWILEHI